ncbi:hypothetical protein Tco_1542961, partial [Tanacetum coccineum]
TTTTKLLLLEDCCSDKWDTFINMDKSWMGTNRTNKSYVDGVAANFASDIPTYGPATVEMVNAIKDNFDGDDLVKFQELLLDAEKPLYEGCPDFTKLSAIVKLLNLQGKYGED